MHLLDFYVIYVSRVIFFSSNLYNCNVLLAREQHECQWQSSLYSGKVCLYFTRPKDPGERTCKNKKKSKNKNAIWPSAITHKRFSFQFVTLQNVRFRKDVRNCLRKVPCFQMTKRESKIATWRSQYSQVIEVQNWKDIPHYFISYLIKIGQVSFIIPILQIRVFSLIFMIENYRFGARTKVYWLPVLTGFHSNALPLQ